MSRSITLTDKQVQELEHILNRLRDCNYALKSLSNRIRGKDFKMILEDDAITIAGIRERLINNIHFYTTNSCHPTNTATTKPPAGTNAAP